MGPEFVYGGADGSFLRESTGRIIIVSDGTVTDEKCDSNFWESKR